MPETTRDKAQKLLSVWFENKTAYLASDEKTWLEFSVRADAAYQTLLDLLEYAIDAQGSGDND